MKDLFFTNQNNFIPNCFISITLQQSSHQCDSVVHTATYILYRSCMHACIQGDSCRYMIFFLVENKSFSMNTPSQVSHPNLNILTK